MMKEQNRKSFSLKFGSTWVQKIIKKTPERNSPRCAIVARADVQVVSHVLQLIPRESRETSTTSHLRNSDSNVSFT